MVIDLTSDTSEDSDPGSGSEKKVVVDLTVDTDSSSDKNKSPTPAPPTAPTHRRTRRKKRSGTLNQNQRRRRAAVLRRYLLTHGDFAGKILQFLNPDEVSAVHCTCKERSNIEMFNPRDWVGREVYIYHSLTARDCYLRSTVARSTSNENVGFILDVQSLCCPSEGHRAMICFGVHLRQPSKDGVWRLL